MESVRARLTAMTPECSVVFYAGSAEAGGTIRVEEFGGERDRPAVRLRLKFSATNFGRTPSLLTAEPCEIAAQKYVTAEWEPPAVRFPLEPAEDRRISLFITAPDIAFIRWSQVGESLTVRLHTESPQSAVRDEFVWTGTILELAAPPTNDRAFDAHQVKVAGPRAPEMTRVWPRLRDPVA